MLLAKDFKQIADNKNEQIANEYTEKIIEYIKGRCEKAAKEGLYGISCMKSQNPTILQGLFDNSNYSKLVREKVENILVSEGFKYLYIQAGYEDEDYIQVSF